MLPNEPRKKFRGSQTNYKSSIMLGLKLPTDPRWVNIVEKNIEEILAIMPFANKKQPRNYWKTWRNRWNTSTGYWKAPSNC